MLFLPWVASTQAVRNDLSRSLLTCILILYRVIWYLSYIDILVYTWWIVILYIFMLNKFCLSPESWVLSPWVLSPESCHSKHQWILWHKFCTLSYANLSLIKIKYIPQDFNPIFSCQIFSNQIKTSQDRFIWWNEKVKIKQLSFKLIWIK